MVYLLRNQITYLLGGKFTMIKELLFRQPTTIGEVKEIIADTNAMFGSDLTIDTLEETYWIIQLQKIDNKFLYFRGFSQAEENSGEGIPIYSSIKNDSRIVLFRSEEQANMYAKQIPSISIVQKYKEN